MATTPRFIPGAGQDNTFRTKIQDYQTPAYAATIALVVNANETLIKPATLTGVASITINADGNAYVGDIVRFLFTPDGTSRVVTFSTGFAPNGTISVTTAKYASISFMYNGVAWVELARTVTA